MALVTIPGSSGVEYSSRPQTLNSAITQSFPTSALCHIRLIALVFVGNNKRHIQCLCSSGTTEERPSLD